MKKVLFWVASFTWGLPMTLFGCFVALALIITGHKPKLFHYLVYFEVGENWGGFECGCFFVVAKNASLHTYQHEAGHGIQNIMYGFITPILSGASALRYWYRRKTPNIKHSDYDSFWYEAQANKLGQKYFK